MGNPNNMIIRPSAGKWAIYDVKEDGLSAEKVYEGSEMECYRERARLAIEWRKEAQK